MDKETGIASPNSFNVDGDEIYCIYDPSHLLKNFKNNLMKYDFKLDDKFVQKYNLTSNWIKFKHITALHNFQVILIYLFLFFHPILSTFDSYRE